jgi:hypothetical protein
MRKLGILVACALLACGPAAMAARPSGPVLTNPQITFVKTSKGGRRELIVANEDGSGAATIYTTTQFLRGELGPDGFVYLWEGPRFGKIPATGGAVQWLFQINSRFGAQSDLSPDGSGLAYFDTSTGTLNRYHIPTGQQHAVASVPELVDLTFDRTGANIIFTRPVGSNGIYELMIVPSSGGTPVSLGLSGPYTNLDASHLDTTLVITVQAPGTAPYLGLWEPGMTAPIRIADGYQGTYRCDDSAIIYQRVVGSGSTLFRRTSAGVITTVAKPEAVFPSYKQVC